MPLIYWSPETFSSRPPDQPKPAMLSYQLTAEGTRLWHSTKDTDGYYARWFTRLAVEELSKRHGPGKMFSILDHEENELAAVRTVKLPDTGP